jgi:uncharacterized protein YdhG (YjbR/CyaY superfamily)
VKRRTGESLDIDGYIASFPPAVRSILGKIRATVAATAPDATELISYRMPAFSQHGILIYFAAFKNHIGVFPPVSGDPRLQRSRIVALRLRQNLAKAAAKEKRSSNRSRR